MSYSKDLWSKLSEKLYSHTHKEVYNIKTSKHQRARMVHAALRAISLGNKAEITPHVATAAFCLWD